MLSYMKILIVFVYLYIHRKYKYRNILHLVDLTTFNDE